MKPFDILCGLLVPLIWGMGFTAAKPVVADFPPILLMALRFAVTALALVWFVRIPQGILRRIALVALVGSAIQYGLTFYGLRLLDASSAVLIVQLEVPFAALLAAVFIGEKLGARKIVGMLIAFVGVVMIAGEPRPGNDLTGVYLVTAGAFAWAVGQVIARTLGSVGGFTMIAWVAVFAAPQLLVASLLVEEDQIGHLMRADAQVWATVIYLGLVMTAVGYGIWYRLLGLYPVAQVAPFLLLLPVFTVAASVLFLGEALTWWLVGGGAVVILGLAVVIVERPARSPRVDPRL
ncbi:MAG: EamA family transporter [Pseudomonadota bacterium]